MHAQTAVRPAAILIVEDEAIVALDLKLQLQDFGYEVVGIADNAAGALRLAEAERPDLALMDVVLRGDGDGIEVAASLRERLGTPVVFLTSFSDTETVQRAAETGPYGYLTKPFQRKELRASIEVALAKARLERQLRDSERWFASTLRCVQDGIVVTDADGLIRFLNPAAEHLTGVPMASAEGLAVDEVVTFLDAVTPPFAWRAALDDGRAIGVRQARRLQHAEGSERPVDEWAGPVHDERGDWLGAVLVLRDASERLKDALLRDELAAERLRREASDLASRSKSEFLSRASHEMRTPLNAVLGFAQLLRMQPQDGATAGVAPAYAQHIFNAGQHLLGLVDDMLDLQRLDHGNTVFDAVPLSLAQVAGEAISLLAPLAAAGSVTVTLHIDTALCVMADERRLRQVVLNLASNAIKYTLPGGHVDCSADAMDDTAADGRIRLRIADAGIGMTAEQLGRLYEPFDRLGREHSGVPGVGLGLVITRKLVEQMQGRLVVTSAPGQGTEATVDLPASPIAAPALATTSPG